MIYQKLISTFSAISIHLLTIDLAHAKDFKIGNIKKTFPMDSLCATYLPKTHKHMLIVIDSGSNSTHAWINIDGKDVELKQIKAKVIKPNVRTIAKYRSNN
jgi:hypothetical protein